MQLATTTFVNPSRPLGYVGPHGPETAAIAIVGEAPGEDEVHKGMPFVGPSGFELDGWLGAAGVGRHSCFITNVCRYRPPRNDIEEWINPRKTSPGPGWTYHRDSGEGLWITEQVKTGLGELEAELARVRPRMVICLGNLALWALTGKLGVSKWRGSVLQGERPWGKFKILVMYHPAAVLRQPELRQTCHHDMRRGMRELALGREVRDREFCFVVRPTFEQATTWLNAALAQLDREQVKIAADIETKAGHIACIGFAPSKDSAICIPFMCLERLEGYWTLDEEVAIVMLIQRLLTHPNIELVGQNFLYDAQYIHRHWHVWPRLARDTMIAHHAMFSTSPKGLDFLASLYCEQYEYWKDEGKEWDTSMPEEDYWTYNCKDCCYTYEVDQGEQDAIKAFGPSWPQLQAVHDFQQRLFWPVVRTMQRGVRRDSRAEHTFRVELQRAAAVREQYLQSVIGRPININSPKQLQAFFYEELAQTEIRKRSAPGSGKPGGLTTDDDALTKIGRREPVLLPVTTRIQELRSIKKFESTYVDMEGDIDGRIRCQFKISGTDTYRFASSENAFGTGGNLQNIPTGDDGDEDGFLPNIRNLFLPDEGYTFFDIDLDSADLRIVTAKAGCQGMQDLLEAGTKPYVEIAREYYNDRTITKNHPSYRTMKALCHGTNYLGTSRGLAERVPGGLLVAEIERIQKWYFGKFPEIRKWQESIIRQVQTRGYIENVFGYRYYIPGRRDDAAFRQAVAWEPQSTVGCLINRIYMKIDENLPQVQILLQVHDSLAGQYPTVEGNAMEKIKQHAQIELPYAWRTIIIPVGVKTSEKSWGACK